MHEQKDPKQITVGKKLRHRLMRSAILRKRVKTNSKIKQQQDKMVSDKTQTKQINL